MPNILKWNRNRKRATVLKKSFSTLLNEEKMRLLQTLIEEEWPDRAIIFANTKHRCEEIWGHLAADGHRVGLLTGDVATEKTSAYS